MGLKNAEIDTDLESIEKVSQMFHQKIYWPYNFLRVSL